MPYTLKYNAELNMLVLERDGGKHAIPEGSPREWGELAEAYLRGDSRFDRERLAFNKDAGQVMFFSPRNASSPKDFLRLSGAETRDICNQVIGAISVLKAGIAADREVLKELATGLADTGLVT